MHLYNYLVNNDYIGPQGKLANSSEILYSMNTCDIVQIDFNYDGTYDHSVVQVQKLWHIQVQLMIDYYRVILEVKDI